jgi:MFS family permease
LTTDLLTIGTTSPPRFTSRQRLILLILLGAGFMLSVDFSILNVALPEVGEGIGLDLTALPWIASAYALPGAGFTLLFGRLADLFGRRRLFLAGIALLAAASLLGGFATNPEMLLTARALQGLSTALSIPASLSLLTTTFEEGATRDRVLGLNGALLSGGFTIGALVGGTLVSLLSWRSAFFINTPVAVIILTLTPFLITESKVPDRVKLDVPGAITVTGGLLAAVYAIIERNIPVGAIGIVLLAAFWVIELRAAAPLAPVRILRRPTVKWGNYAGLVLFSMETSMIFMMTLYLQKVLAFDPLITGLIFGVPGLAAVLAGPIAGRLIGRHGYRKVLPAGLALQGLAIGPADLHRRRPPDAGRPDPRAAHQLLRARDVHRGVHGHRHVRPAERGAGPGHRPHHDDAERRRHDRHPDPERDRRHPDAGTEQNPPGDVATEVLRLTGGKAPTACSTRSAAPPFGASLAAAKRVTAASSYTAWPAAKRRSPTRS